MPAHSFISLSKFDDIEGYVAKMPDELKPHFRELYGMTPRLTPIVVGAFLDDLLADLLRARLTEGKVSADYVNNLNNKNRLTLCRCLGLIPDGFAEALASVATVRNHFAHMATASYQDEKALRALKRIWEVLVRDGGLLGKHDAATIEATLKSGYTSLETDDDHGRLLLVTMYGMIRGYLVEVTQRVTRVDSPLQGSPYVRKL